MTWSWHFACKQYLDKRSAVSRDFSWQIICLESALKLYHWTVSALIHRADECLQWWRWFSAWTMVRQRWEQVQIRHWQHIANNESSALFKTPSTKRRIIKKILKRNLSVVSGILYSLIYTLSHKQFVNTGVLFGSSCYILNQNIAGQILNMGKWELRLGFTLRRTL